MRSAVLALFLWVCISCGDVTYIAVMGCPPGVECWPWHLNPHPVPSTQHIPQQPLGQVMGTHNWPHTSHLDSYVQRRLPVSQQQWMWSVHQQATSAHLVLGAAVVPSGQSSQTTSEINRPMGSSSQSLHHQQTKQGPPISPASSQSGVRYLPHKNFNPKYPAQESPNVHRHIVRFSPTQVIPPRNAKPDQWQFHSTTPPSATESRSGNKYLCDIWKRYGQRKNNQTSSPAPPQNYRPTQPPNKSPALPRPTSTHPPTKQPRPIVPGISTTPTNQVVNGTSPSVIACQRYRNDAVSFLDNQVRIHGGRYASKGEFPYMVAIGYIKDETLVWACGGSLISERFVLTAGHCVQSSECIPNPREAMVMRMGEIRLNAGAGAERRRPEDYGAEELLPHPSYRFPEVLYHDVALVRTDRPVAFSAGVRPACLPTPALLPTPGARWTSAGWGNDGTLVDNAFQEDLKKAEMIELAETKCPIEGRSKVPKGLDSRILCAQHHQNNVCGGDSGGPLVQQDVNGQDVLVGVFSSSGNPCSGNKTALFVRITSELQWIERTVWPK